jgi:hypothetical protein
MNCYAWKIPEGCYASALGGGDGCPSAMWWWIAAAVATGLLLTQGGKRKPVRQVRSKRK